jgi:hypothetical protein
MRTEEQGRQMLPKKLATGIDAIVTKVPGGISGLAAFCVLKTGPVRAALARHEAQLGGLLPSSLDSGTGSQELMPSRMGIGTQPKNFQ